MVGESKHLTLGRTHFSALEQYKAGEGDGDPNCSGKYATKDIAAAEAGQLAKLLSVRAKKGTSETQSSKERSGEKQNFR